MMYWDRVASGGTLHSLPRPSLSTRLVALGPAAPPRSGRGAGNWLAVEHATSPLARTRTATCCRRMSIMESVKWGCQVVLLQEERRRRPSNAVRPPVRGLTSWSHGVARARRPPIQPAIGSRAIGWAFRVLTHLNFAEAGLQFTLVGRCGRKTSIQEHRCFICFTRLGHLPKFRDATQRLDRELVHAPGPVQAGHAAKPSPAPVPACSGCAPP
jgi:hypothetical protein